MKLRRDFLAQKEELSTKSAKHIIIILSIFINTLINQN